MTEFKILKSSQDLAATLFNVTSKANKNYRLTLCQYVNHLACDLVHTIRKANNLQLGTESRLVAQQEVLEFLARLQDMMPVLRGCRCCTIKEEGQLEKKLGELEDKVRAWVTSDKRRLNKM